MPEVFVESIKDFAEGDRRIVFHGCSIASSTGSRFYAYENLCLHQGGPLLRRRDHAQVEDVLAPRQDLARQRFSRRGGTLRLPRGTATVRHQTASGAATAICVSSLYEVVRAAPTSM